MLNIDYIQSNEAITSLLAGDLSHIRASIGIDHHFIDGTNQNVNDFIFKINIATEISQPNRKAKRFFDRNKISYLKDFIPLPSEGIELLHSEEKGECSFIVNADDINETIQKSIIERKISKSDKKQKNKKEDTKLIQEQIENNKTLAKEFAHPMFVTIRRVCDDDPLLIVIVSRDIRKEKLVDSKANKIKELDAIMKRILPHDLRSLYNDENTVIWKEKVVLVAIKMLQTEQYSEETIDNTLNTMTVFNQIVYAAAKNVKDCSIAKKFSTTIFAVFNFVSQEYAYKDIIPQCVQFIKEIKKNCDEKNIQITVSIVPTENIALGRLHKLSTNFNLYAKEMSASYALVRMGKPSFVRLTKKAEKFLTVAQKSKAQSQEVENGNYQCFEIDISDL